jgi:hypothetical protein
MDANKRFFLHYLLSRLGLRVHRHRNYLNIWDFQKYPGLKGKTNAVIFDVGANIGQTSNLVWTQGLDSSVPVQSWIPSCGLA